MVEYALWIAIGAALLTLVYGIFSIMWVLAKPNGNDRMQEIAGAIQEGAKAYLNRQYMTIGIVGLIMFLAALPVGLAVIVSLTVSDDVTFHEDFTDILLNGLLVAEFLIRWLLLPRKAFSSHPVEPSLWRPTGRSQQSG